MRLFDKCMICPARAVRYCTIATNTISLWNLVKPLHSSSMAQSCYPQLGTRRMTALSTPTDFTTVMSGAPTVVQATLFTTVHYFMTIVQHPNQRDVLIAPRKIFDCLPGCTALPCPVLVSSRSLNYLLYV